MTLRRTQAIFSSIVIALILGVGMQLGVRTAQAQAAGTSSTPEAQSPAKNQQEADENDAYRKSPAVVAIGRKIGLNPEQSATAFEVLNFLMLALAAIWALGKVLPKMLRDRNTNIQKHLVDARTATEEARARLSSVEARLARLDDEIAAMRTHAEQDSLREESRLKTLAEEEKQKILASAEQEIAAATMHAQKQLQQHAAELAIEQAARKLVVSAETDRLLIQNFAQRLGSDDSKKGQN